MGNMAAQTRTYFLKWVIRAVLLLLVLHTAGLSAYAQEAGGIQAASIALWDGGQPFSGAAADYSARTLQVKGTGTDFTAGLSVKLVRIGSAQSYNDKISNIRGVGKTSFTFELLPGLLAGDYKLLVNQMEAGFEVTSSAGPVDLPFASLVLTAPKTQLTVNEEVQLQVMGQKIGGEPEEVTASPHTFYEAIDPAFVSVASGGRVKALQDTAGNQAKVKVTYNAGTAMVQQTLSFTVQKAPESDKPILSISLVSDSLSVYVDEELQLKAIATYGDRTTKDITAEAEWQSLAPSVASVQHGKVKGNRPGKVAIKASLGTQTGQADIIVNVTGGDPALPGNGGTGEDSSPTGGTGGNAGGAIGGQGQTGGPTGSIGPSAGDALDPLGQSRMPQPDTSAASEGLPFDSRDEGGITMITVNINESMLLVEQSKAPWFHIDVPVQSREVQAAVPAGLLAAISSKNSGVTVKASSAEFNIPAAPLWSLIESRFGSAAAAKVDVIIGIAYADSLTASKAQADASAKGAKMLVQPLDFTVTLTGPDKSVAVESWGNTFVQRSLLLDSGSFQPEHASVYLYDPLTRQYRHVPTKFTLDPGGRMKAVFLRNGNSLYTVLEAPASFRDVGTDHWARQNIEVMAAKGILKGVGEGTFDPNGNITRAQFAAILLRALGIEPMKPSGIFSDVRQEDWFAPELEAAYRAGIISGRSETVFDPNGLVTRQEMAKMIENAMAAAGQKALMTEGEIGTRLAVFQDSGQISDYARGAVAAALSSHIVNGISDNRFDPSGAATRAQASTIVIKMLRAMDWVN